MYSGELHTIPRGLIVTMDAVDVRKNLIKILKATKNYGQITRISWNGEIMAVIKPVKNQKAKYLK